MAHRNPLVNILRFFLFSFFNLQWVDSNFASATENEIKLSYVTYSLFFDTNYLYINQILNTHQATAVLHMVHTGLHIEFSNGSYSEIHYGHNKWGFGHVTDVSVLNNMHYHNLKWKGIYEIGSIYSESQLVEAKNQIIEEWNQTNYWLGRHDCWGFVVDFSHKNFNLTSELLDGPIGAHFTSPAHLIRYAFDKLFLFYQFVFHYPGHKALCDYINQIIMQPIHDKEAYEYDYAIRPTIMLRKAFDSFSRELKTILLYIAAIPFPLPLLPILYAIAAIKVTTYLFSRKKKTYSFELDSLLSSSRLGPNKYLGSYVYEDNSNGDDYDDLSLNVARLESRFPIVMNGSSLKIVGSDGGEFYVDCYGDIKNANTIFIFVPGTASSVSNHEISKMNASHLSNAIDAPLVLVNHRLAPWNKWPTPFNDVCDAIKYIHQENKYSNIALSGYSSGGLLVVLAMLVMMKQGIPISRLFLFSPLLDISGEFRCNSFDPYKEENRYYIPVNIFPEELADWQETATRSDDVINIDYLNKMITRSFSDKLRKNPKNLRRLSPLWFPISILSKFHSWPETTIITGENDILKAESLIFYHKLQEAGHSSMMVLFAEKNHGLFWNSIFPFYMLKTILFHPGIEQVFFSEDVSVAEEEICTNFEREKLLEKKYRKAKANLKNISFEEVEEYKKAQEELKVLKECLGFESKKVRDSLGRFYDLALNKSNHNDGFNDEEKSSLKLS
ncbi:MAG: alpha/beta hydrolase fold domain-containing protein [Gammaproteobacteria bacterium]